MNVVPQLTPLPNIMEQMIPIRDPALHEEYQYLRREWFKALLFLQRHITVHVAYGPSDMGQNIVVVYALRIISLESAMAGVRTADIKLRAAEEAQNA